MPKIYPLVFYNVSVVFQKMQLQHIEGNLKNLNRPLTNRQHFPIIVGGPHRSGTSLVRRLLNNHPNLYCGPEVKFFEDFFRRTGANAKYDFSFMQTACSMVDKEILFEELGLSFLRLHERAAKFHKKNRWADKCPENIIYLNEWEQLLGDKWVFVHVARNPLDTLASQVEAQFNRVLPSSLSEKIDVFKTFHQGGLTFQTKYPDRYYRVIYEELVKNPSETLKGLDDWLGEDFYPCQLDITAKNFQAGLEDPKVATTRAIHQDSINRWPLIISPDQASVIISQTRELWHILDTKDVFDLAYVSNDSAK